MKKWQMQGSICVPVEETPEPEFVDHWTWRKQDSERVEALIQASQEDRLVIGKINVDSGMIHMGDMDEDLCFCATGGDGEYPVYAELGAFEGKRFIKRVVIELDIEQYT